LLQYEEHAFEDESCKNSTKDNQNQHLSLHDLTGALPMSAVKQTAAETTLNGPFIQHSRRRLPLDPCGGGGDVTKGRGILTGKVRGWLQA